MAEKAHPAMAEIRKMRESKEFEQALRGAGYVPDTTWALQEVSEEAKLHQLGLHSERSALLYGLLKTPPHTTLRIAKNLRMCNDCHNATKAIAKAYGRRIVVRDMSRFHHFEVDGTCSCGDYY